MDEHDIGQAVVLPLVSPESSGYLITVDYVLAETKPHRDRLIPFCCIDPRTSYTNGRHGLRYMIKKWIDAGAKGFGEHKAGVAVDHPGNVEIYTICNEMKLPLIFQVPCCAMNSFHSASFLPSSAHCASTAVCSNCDGLPSAVPAISM